MQVFQLCSLLCALIKLIVSCDWLPAECSWALCVVGGCWRVLQFSYWILRWALKTLFEILGLHELVWCIVPSEIHPVTCVFFCPVCETLDLINTHMIRSQEEVRKIDFFCFIIILVIYFCCGFS